jgi:hypothetical protein
MDDDGRRGTTIRHSQETNRNPCDKRNPQEIHAKSWTGDWPQRPGRGKGQGPQGPRATGAREARTRGAGADGPALLGALRGKAGGRGPETPLLLLGLLLLLLRDRLCPPDQHCCHLQRTQVGVGAAGAGAGP